MKMVTFENIKLEQIPQELCDYLNDRSKFHDFGQKFSIRGEGIIEDNATHQEEYRGYLILLDEENGDGEIVEKHSYQCKFTTTVKIDIEE